LRRMKTLCSSAATSRQRSSWVSGSGWPGRIGGSRTSTSACASGWRKWGARRFANYLAADPKPGPEREPPGLQLANITVPTLVVVGQRDIEEILATAARLATEIPAARKVTVADVGHMISLERPNDFTKLVTDFLTSIR
jgi:pimeloyl-ACP methyl ester carboxylesterase